jgi:hypothetical protein
VKDPVADLARLMVALRAGGCAVYVGPVPGDGWAMLMAQNSVRLEMHRDAAPATAEPEPPAKVAGDPPDPIDALNARLFGDPLPAKVNDGA